MLEKVKKDVILSASYVVPISSAPIKEGAVLIRNGRIKDIGDARIITSKYPEISCRHFDNAIILPGLINAHIHLEYSALGPLSERTDFITWIKNLIIKQKTFSIKEITASITDTIKKLLSSGITCIGEVSRSGLSLELLAESGLNGVYYSELVAIDDNRSEKSLHDFKVAFNKANDMLKKSNFKSGIFPHSVYTLSSKVLKYASNLSKSKELPCGIHAAEHSEENEFVSKGTGALSDFVSQFQLETPPEKGKWCNTIEYLNRMGMLTPNTQLIHCVHLQESDFPIIQKAQSGIVLCPRSNFLLKNGEFPFLSSLKYNLKMGLGTDSLASNSSLDMFEELRFLKENIQRKATSLNKTLNSYPPLRGGEKGEGEIYNDINTSSSPHPRQASLPARGVGAVLDINTRLLEIATLGGASVLGIQDETGSLSLGKQADIIAVRIEDNHQRESFSPVNYLISQAVASNVIFTMINGFIV